MDYAINQCLLASALVKTITCPRVCSEQKTKSVARRVVSQCSIGVSPSTATDSPVGREKLSWISSLESAKNEFYFLTAGLACNSGLSPASCALSVRNSEASPNAFLTVSIRSLNRVPTLGSF